MVSVNEFEPHLQGVDRCTLMTLSGPAYCSQALQAIVTETRWFLVRKELSPHMVGLLASEAQLCAVWTDGSFWASGGSGAARPSRVPF